MAQDDETALLIEMLTNPRTKPAQKAQAARLLGHSNAPEAIPALIGVVEDTTDPFKLQVVTAALGALPRFGAAAVPYYTAVLASDDTMRRPYMPRLLVETGDPSVAGLLLDCLRDRQPDVVINAITALGSLKTSAAYDALLEILRDEGQPAAVRGIAASALGATGDPRGYEPLAALLLSGDRDLLGGAVDGIAELGDTRAAGPLEALLAHGGLDVALERGVRLAVISLRARQSERARGLR